MKKLCSKVNQSLQIHSNFCFPAAVSLDQLGQANGGVRVWSENIASEQIQFSFQFKNLSIIFLPPHEALISQASLVSEFHLDGLSISKTLKLLD